MDVPTPRFLFAAEGHVPRGATEEQLEDRPVLAEGQIRVPLDEIQHAFFILVKVKVVVEPCLRDASSGHRDCRRGVLPVGILGKESEEAVPVVLRRGGAVRRPAQTKEKQKCGWRGSPITIATTNVFKIESRFQYLRSRWPTSSVVSASHSFCENLSVGFTSFAVVEDFLFLTPSRK